MPSSSEADVEASRVNIFLHAENTRIFSNDHLDRRLPVTLVTGHLGSGKTTLLKHILTNRSNLRIAAAINDFAELNIDEKLVKNVADGAERVVELSNGCVCCHLLDDLKSAVFKLLETGGAVDTDEVNYLVVETSGVTDPMSVIRTLDAKFGKCFRARLDSVVTVIDSDQFLHCPLSSSEAIAQLQAADIVLMNKVDLLRENGTDLDLVEGRIRSYNPTAEIHRTIRSSIPLDRILDVSPANDGGAGGDTVIPITHERTKVPLYVSSTGGALRRDASSSIGGSSHGSHLLAKSSGYSSLSVTLADRPLSLAKLQQFVTSPRVQKLARMKGVLWIHGMGNYRCILHLSGRGRLGFELDGKWAGPPASELAFIGPRVDTDLETEFGKCCIDKDEMSGKNSSVEIDDRMLQELSCSKEFEIVDGSTPKDSGITFFRVSGSKYFNYTDEEIERVLRIDTNAMNLDLADAINASVANEKGCKGFITHTIIPDQQGKHRTVLCYCGGEPANNFVLLKKLAGEVLATYFRNVSDCRCGK